MTAPPRFGRLAGHGRFEHSSLPARPDFRWPGGARLAVYIGFNLEQFAFGEGLGANIGPTPLSSPDAPDVLNHAWREWGNRVGAWRCLDLFDELALPTATLVNTALYEHCPDVVHAFASRGDEIVAHGHSNAERQGTLAEADERALIEHGRDRIAREHGRAPAGWLSPWISESRSTPDLLAEAGFAYTLNWCHDDQPTRLATRAGPLWAVPYPQELNDIPMVIGRLMDGEGFARMVHDQFDEMLALARRTRRPQTTVMGIALHPYIVGHPHRLRPLRRALRHIAEQRGGGDVWITTPGAIAQAMDSLPSAADGDA